MTTHNNLPTAQTNPNGATGTATTSVGASVQASALGRTRRLFLRRAGNLLGLGAAATALGSAAALAPDTAQARVIMPGNGTNAGAIIVRNGITPFGTLAENARFGLLVSATEPNLNYTGGLMPSEYDSSQGIGLYAHGPTAAYFLSYKDPVNGGGPAVISPLALRAIARGPYATGLIVEADTILSSSETLPVGASISSTGSGALALTVAAYGKDAKGLNVSAAGLNSQAASFSGNVTVYGSLSKSGGTFKIDHPLNPANKYLYHSFVESPDRKNIYDGVVTLDGRGEATVTLPEWFEALNRDYRYQLTALDAPAPSLHIAGRVKDGTFQIAGGQAGQEIAWQVTGIRQDAWAKANPVQVEVEKSADEPPEKAVGRVADEKREHSMKKDGVRPHSPHPNPK
jgi:hypothetical protein